MSADQVFQLLIQGSPLELLALFIIASYLQVVVLGPFYKALLKDRDEWRSMAISATATAKTQAEQIAALTEVTETLSQALGKRAR